MNTVVRGISHTKSAGSSTVGNREITIRRTTGFRLLDLRELWAYRELVYFLTWRNIKVRYKQTTMGVAWVILQPLATMAAYSVLFGRLARIPSDGIPYPLFAFAALVPWQFFSRATSESMHSLLANQNIVTRAYIPRIGVPLATTLAASVDLMIATGLLVGLMALYRVAPTPAIIWLPAFVVLLFITTLGVGFWLAALNISSRDVTHVVPLLSQLWFYATPVVYPDSMVPPRWRVLYGLNPMSGVVKGFRWSLLGAGGGPWHALALSVLVAVIVFVTGILVFRHRERTFVDVM